MSHWKSSPKGHKDQGISLLGPSYFVLTSGNILSLKLDPSWCLTRGIQYHSIIHLTFFSVIYKLEITSFDGVTVFDRSIN